MLSKVFPIELKPGMQAEAEAIVAEFAPRFAGLVVEFVEIDHELLVSH